MPMSTLILMSVLISISMPVSMAMPMQMLTPILAPMSIPMSMPMLMPMLMPMAISMPVLTPMRIPTLIPTSMLIPMPMTLLPRVGRTQRRTMRILKWDVFVGKHIHLLAERRFGFNARAVIHGTMSLQGASDSVKSKQTTPTLFGIARLVFLKRRARKRLILQRKIFGRLANHHHKLSEPKTTLVETRHKLRQLSLLRRLI
mmetsp:Transcript_12188/g.25699  ORF Transcript_12188/g.25699 Transcript_12188/m.25699 type:complete len:201 (+) Transcript_12188:137-739(+)